MRDKQQRPYYDADVALIKRVKRLITESKDAIKLGVTIIVNNDGTKQEYKRKRRQQ